MDTEPVGCINCPFGIKGTAGVMCTHPETTSYWNTKRHAFDDSKTHPHQWNNDQYVCRYHPVVEKILRDAGLLI